MKAVSHAHANLDLADAVGSFTRHLRAESLAASSVATYVKALDALDAERVTFYELYERP